MAGGTVSDPLEKAADAESGERHKLYSYLGGDVLY
jgi:hypothetical protein